MAGEPSSPKAGMRTLGVALSMIGGGTVILSNGALNAARVGLGLRLSVLLAGSISAGLGGWLINRSKRLEQRWLALEASGGAAAEVLYFRSFHVDKHVGPLSHYGVDDSFEQNVVRAFGAFGNVVAIGDPRDSLPPPGALRLEANNGEWQMTVESLLPKARLAVFAVSLPSDSLLWELNKCLTKLEPKKLVLVVSPGSNWAQFREATHGMFGGPLPEAIPRSGMIMFGADFTPKEIPDVTSAALRGNFGLQDYYKLYLANLGPVFDRFPEIQRPKVTAFSPGFVRLLLIVVAIGVVLIGLIDVRAAAIAVPGVALLLGLCYGPGWLVVFLRRRKTLRSMRPGSSNP